MVKRRKIGLLYEYNENWIGGTYYIQNLIFALNRLPDQEKPFLVIICNEYAAYDGLKKTTGYPFMVFRRLSRKRILPYRVINKISRAFFNKNIFEVIRYSHFNDVEVLFPAINHTAFIKVRHKLFWIPDLQEHFYPNFFSKAEIDFRLQQQKMILDNKWMVLFSSKTALSHFNEIYPNNTNQKFVMPFTVNLQHLNEVKFADIASKYSIDAPYFMCSNQFWQHKNHIVIFEAISILNKRGLVINMILTGNESDYRDRFYFQKLKNSITSLNIANQIKFLGFINRSDQIVLLKNAKAVIQPSLFEGWSTVVEDAKALNIRILCSDIPVHQEQLEDYPNKTFFAVNDANDLSIQMELSMQIHKNEYFNYAHAQSRHTTTLKKIVDSIAN